MECAEEDSERVGEVRGVAGVPQRLKPELIAGFMARLSRALPDRCPLLIFLINCNSASLAALADSRGRLLPHELIGLFQSFHQIQICEHSVVAEDAAFGVGGHVDGADVFYSGGVGGHEFFPERALAGFQVEAVDAGG